MLIEKIDGFFRLVIDRVNHRFVIGLDVENDKICLYERNCADDHALWFFKGVNNDKEGEIDRKDRDQNGEWFKICNKL